MTPARAQLRPTTPSDVLPDVKGRRVRYAGFRAEGRCWALKVRGSGGHPGLQGTETIERVIRRDPGVGGGHLCPLV